MPAKGGASAPGKCSVCGLVFHIVPSTGVLRRHGFGGSFPPCVGSGLLPMSISHDGDSSVVDVGMCSSLSESAINESIESFPMSPPSVKFIERITRSARHKAAIVFESCLRDVINVGSLPHWDHLFNFATDLRQPSRGGHRLNLTARILDQLEEFDSGVVFIRKPATSDNANSKLPISRTVDSEKKAAVKASIKLDAGDVKGAIQVFLSDDAFVIPILTSYNTLLTKHPVQPSHRRQSPPITSDAYSCTISQLLPAVKSFGPGSTSGWDGLSLQHLQDMVQMSSPTGLPAVLCDFVNLVLAGGIPHAVRPICWCP